MSKKQDAFYFDNFVACAECSCQAIRLLQETLSDFRPGEISGRLTEIHEIEHQADSKKHILTDKLAKAFITPIEREDIISLSHHIDEVTDKIEDVLIRIYINNVQTIRPDAMELIRIVENCCKALTELLGEFSNFRHSDSIRKKIISINSLEEEADSLYIESMRRLHAEEKDPLEVIAWREIYDYLEKCADACEHAADTVGNIVMKNS